MIIQVGSIFYCFIFSHLHYTHCMMKKIIVIYKEEAEWVFLHWITIWIRVPGIHLHHFLSVAILRGTECKFIHSGTQVSAFFTPFSDKSYLQRKIRSTNTILQCNVHFKVKFRFSLQQQYNTKRHTLTIIFILLLIYKIHNHFAMREKKTLKRFTYLNSLNFYYAFEYEFMLTHYELNICLLKLFIISYARSKIACTHFRGCSKITLRS